MRIVFSIAHMNLGGAQRVCYNLINWLRNNTDADVHLIVYSNRQDKESFDLSDIPHITLRGGVVGKIRDFRKKIRSLKPDILVTMGVPQAVFDVPAVLGLNIRHIISERNDPAHFGGKTSVRIISRLLMRLADGYVFQTLDAQKYYGGRIAKKSVIISNPLYNAEQMPNLRYEGKDTKTIVSVGRLHRQKNHPLLISAFKEVNERFHDYRLVIYGEGPERKNDESFIQEMGLEEKVLLPGATTKVLESIYDATLFVFSSDFEGMPNALMEAMALGLPCVSTDCPCGGPRELIEEGRNGILVPVGDKKAMVKAIIQMIEDDKKRETLGRNAMKIRETHNIDTICKKWYEYFLYVNKKER